MAHMGKVKNTYKLSVMKPEEKHGRSSVYHYTHTHTYIYTHTRTHTHIHIYMVE